MNNSKPLLHTCWDFATLAPLSEGRQSNAGVLFVYEHRARRTNETPIFMILLMDKLLHTAVGAWPFNSPLPHARSGREHQKKTYPLPLPQEEKGTSGEDHDQKDSGNGSGRVSLRAAGGKGKGTMKRRRDYGKGITVAVRQETGVGQRQESTRAVSYMRGTYRLLRAAVIDA